MRRRTPLARTGRIAPKRRTKAEHERVYGTPERLAWLQSLPCLICARVPVELAHTANGGVGRKADADTICPLCRYCHLDLHQMGAATFARVYAIDLRAEAARINALWEARCAA